MGKKFLDNLEWRWAVKKFDSSKKISAADLEQILKAIRYTPSSWGLQSYHVFVISDQSLKNRLQAAAYQQSQVGDCSHLLVFCARTNIYQRIDEYLKLSQKINNFGSEQIASKRLSMVKSMDKKGTEGVVLWADRQVYIALGFALAACAELQIDSCPMEGFDKEKVNQVLSLPSHLESSVLLALGQRASEPEFKKIRFPQEDLFTFI